MTEDCMSSHGHAWRHMIISHRAKKPQVTHIDANMFVGCSHGRGRFSDIGCDVCVVAKDVRGGLWPHSHPLCIMRMHQ